jgi:hypothetical protein
MQILTSLKRWSFLTQPASQTARNYLILWYSGQSSNSEATRFSEKECVWNGVFSASRVQLRSYLKEKVAAPVKRIENTAVGVRQADHVALSSKVGTNFADKRRSLGRYSSLAYSDHGEKIVCCFSPDLP